MGNIKQNHLVQGAQVGFTGISTDDKTGGIEGSVLTIIDTIPWERWIYHDGMWIFDPTSGMGPTLYSF
jgi:hypothetical protein